ncbi:MAG: cyclic pyranopterin monophosphate synthase MoaC [Planctomycetota bacterium]
MTNRSTHIDAEGNVHMVDVSGKASSKRIAVSQSVIRMLPDTAQAIRAGTGKKGDVLTVAQIAGIQAAKLTQQLIPLCHAIPIESVRVEFEWASPSASLAAGDSPSGSSAQLVCRVTAATTAKTGIEMEAMTAASVAALTVYDMMKSVDRSMEIVFVGLLEKSGGKSGAYRRETTTDPERPTRPEGE